MIDWIGLCYSLYRNTFQIKVSVILNWHESNSNFSDSVSTPETNSCQYPLNSYWNENVWTHVRIDATSRHCVHLLHFAQRRSIRALILCQREYCYYESSLIIKFVLPSENWEDFLCKDVYTSKEIIELKQQKEEN